MVTCEEKLNTFNRKEHVTAAKGEPMNKLLVVMIALAFVATGCSKKVELKTDNQKVSYAIGHQIGQSLKTQAKDVNLDVMRAAMEDVLKGKEPRMKQNEMREAIMKMQRKFMEKQREEGKKNAETGKKFLEDNKKKEGVKTTESGLQYKVITAGKGKKPSKDSVVKVHYKGTLIDGSEFDSSYTRNKPAEFSVTGVIKGWTEALMMMKQGAKWQLFIPPELGYGSSPRPKIPANSVLIFEVELLEVKAKPKK
jgi:FKBP-type peptidyl-prolyl cis-trans isomerase